MLEKHSAHELCTPFPRSPQRTAGLPISPLMDRTKAGVTKSQPGFFAVVVLPLFSAFVAVVPGAAPMLQVLEGAGGLAHAHELHALHKTWLLKRCCCPC